MTTDDRHEFDIGPGSDMQRKYGWYAENRPDIQVDSSDVPSTRRDLIPYVERWAIACDVTRQDYFETQPPGDVREFAATVGAREAAINQWLDSIAGPWPPAAKHFLYLLKARSEAACEFPKG